MADVQDRAQRAVDALVRDGRETAVQVAAYLRGELIVDVVAGAADPEAGRPADVRTLFNCWSTGKGSASTVIHVLAERGLLGYGTPIAEYWPEFAAHGKRTATLGHLLAHTAGVPQAPRDLTVADLADWDGTCAAIADLRPLWEPGTATGYHALTFGYIAGEIVRRVTGQTIAEVLRDTVAEPLGIADSLFFGVPVAEFPRVARLEDGNWAAMTAAWPGDSPFFTACPRSLVPRADLGNQPGYLTTDVPSAGTMTARAAARMYAALIGEVDGFRLISPQRAAQIAEVATAAPDRILGQSVPKGLGYFLRLPEMGRFPGTFGCKGSGGSIAFADQAHGLAFAFTHNRLTAPPADTTAQIADQVRGALGIPAGD